MYVPLFICATEKICYGGNLKKENAIPIPCTFLHAVMLWKNVGEGEKWMEGSALWGEIMETDEGSGEEECETCEME